jgi:galactose mutarotase-like enzyme
MPTMTRIANPHLAVDVSSLGAEMRSIETPDGKSWLWNGNAAYWTGRSPVLFPIVGKASDDTVEIDGKPYPMAQHGIARRREFALVSSQPTACRYELQASEETRAVYPFDFTLAVEHVLDGPSLTVAAEVSNHGDTAMPYGIGFHPAFVWPLSGAGNRPHTITLENRGEPPLVRLEGGLLGTTRLPSPFSAGRLVLDHAQYEADAMIFPDGAGERLIYGVEGGPALNFRFENLPNLALWTKPGAPFICIEPWHGMAAENGRSRELTDRPFTSILESGGTRRYSFTVTFDV